MKITFKEYVESKDALRKAVENTPIRESVFEVVKYCKLPVLSESLANEISLKPKHKIHVVLEYISFDNPIIKSVNLLNVSNINTHADISVSIPGKKFVKWIDKNTKDITDYS